ncbi:MAG: hypothetical protein OJJ54_24605, partial [Pseudonocardia sp.]|nr:hypothetical protein [Pseudonocardia sp.]
MSSDSGPVGRMLKGLAHGGYVVDDNPATTDKIKVEESLSSPAEAGLTQQEVTFSTPFGYMFADLAGTFPAQPGADPEEIVDRLRG